jgi:hypothetical protein
VLMEAFIPRNDEVSVRFRVLALGQSEVGSLIVLDTLIAPTVSSSRWSHSDHDA